MKLNFSKSHYLIGAVALALLLAAALFGYAFRSPVDTSTPEEIVPDEIHRHPLTGALIDEPLEELPRVYGVMVENHVDAVPQSGLQEAFLVIEAPVEGAIPRMLAFYSEDQEDDFRIGPVRSARPYYIDWNAQFGAVYAHVGGSPEALDILAADNTIDINEFAYGGYFWRDGRRLAPHNVYTDLGNLADAEEAFYVRNGLEEETPSYESWLFKNPLEDQVEDEFVDTIQLIYGNGSYDIEWVVNDDGLYERFQNGTAHRMSDRSQIVVENVVVMQTAIEVIDSVGRRSIETRGEGRALVFQDGYEIAATWRMDNKGDRLRFYNNDTDEEVVMNAGTTWVHVVDSLETPTINRTCDWGRHPCY